MCRSLKTRNAIAIPERVEILAQKMAGNSRFEPNRYACFEGPFTARKPEADDHTLELLLRAETRHRQMGIESPSATPEPPFRATANVYLVGGLLPLRYCLPITRR